MKTLQTLSLLGLSVVLAGAVGSGCVIEETAADGGDGGSNSSSSSGTGGAIQTSEHISEAELTRMVSALAADAMDGREPGTPGGDMARAYIMDEMLRCGLQPVVNGSYEQRIATGQGSNLLGLIPGTDPALAARHVILSAHFDHLGHCDGAICNGANDNAAGVAIVLGVACALAEDPPPQSVLIATWDAEEPPAFSTAAMGSEFYAANPIVPLEQTDAVIVEELVGGGLWLGHPAHYLTGAELSPQLAGAIAATPAPTGLPVGRGGLHMLEELPTGHQAWSDYDAFRNRQVPVVMAVNGFNQTYHSETDEVNTLNLPKMALQAQYTLDLMRTLTSGGEKPVFVADGADYALDAYFTKVLLEEALAPGTGIVDVMGLAPESRTNLEADLVTVTALGDKLGGGTPASPQDVATLRGAFQRMFCYAYPFYPEAACNMM
ncbi:MAG: M28 family peptidase [Deltaproteobacteria bacterium]|nr:M28 family peptidase [Deltaproteobacteria bacterium]